MKQALGFIIFVICAFGIIFALSAWSDSKQDDGYYMVRSNRDVWLVNPSTSYKVEDLTLYNEVTLYTYWQSENKYNLVNEGKNTKLYVDENRNYYVKVSDIKSIVVYGN